MEKMTKDEMIEFLKGMEKREKILQEEKASLRGSVETLEEAITRNNFAHHDDGSGIVASGFAPDKVLRILLNSQRDIEDETRAMVLRMRDIYEKEDQINYVRKCLLKMGIQDQYLIREAYFNDMVMEKLVTRFNISRSQIYRKLHKAVENLVKIYNASCHEVSSFRAQRLINEVIPYMPEGSFA